MLQSILLTLLVLATLLLCAASAFLYYHARMCKRSSDKLARVIKELITVVSNSEVRSLPLRLAESADNIKGLKDVVESYHKGVVAVAEAQVAATTGLESGVREFKDLMFQRGGDRGVNDYDEAAAGREHEIEEIMRTGASRESAEGRVKEKDLYSGLNGVRGR